MTKYRVYGGDRSTELRFRGVIEAKDRFEAQETAKGNYDYPVVRVDEIKERKKGHESGIEPLGKTHQIICPLMSIGNCIVYCTDFCGMMYKLTNECSFVVIAHNLYKMRQK